jgi:DNA-binding MarR family transcriptional regulator
MLPAVSSRVPNRKRTGAFARLRKPESSAAVHPGKETNASAATPRIGRTIPASFSARGSLRAGYVPPVERPGGAAALLRTRRLAGDRRLGGRDACWHIEPRRRSEMSGTAKIWIDAETKIADAEGDEHDQLRLWLRLFSVARLMENDVRRRLLQEFETTFPRFDILSQIERVPEGLNLGELSRRLMVSPGNITSVIKRLAEDGLILRTQNPTDRRESFVRITPLGQSTFAAMAAAHEGWIRRLTAGLDPAETRALLLLLRKLKASVRETVGTAPSPDPE